jgi:FKBP-type peptidyl-prolyl cis-trans isomerase FklB
MPAWAAEKPVITTLDDQISYSVGHQVGRDLVRQEVKLNPEVLMQGILDATSGNEPMMPFDQMIDTLVVLKEKIVKKAEQKNDSMRVRGQEFLAANKKNEGVVTLESGLQYKIIKEGTGKKPAVGELVKVNYTGKDINGKTFDTTYTEGQWKPLQFKLEGVIPGWLEALQLMKEGSKWEIYIPYQLAFPATTPLRGQTVIYEIELMQVGS